MISAKWEGLKKNKIVLLKHISKRAKRRNSRGKYAIMKRCM